MKGYIHHPGREGLGRETKGIEAVSRSKWDTLPLSGSSDQASITENTFDNAQCAGKAVRKRTRGKEPPDRVKTLAAEASIVA